MAIVPPRLLSPAQTFRFLKDLDSRMGGNYTAEMLNVDFFHDRHFMTFAASSFEEVDGFAVRRFASLVYANQVGEVKAKDYGRLTSAISNLLITFSRMQKDGVEPKKIFPLTIDLDDYMD